MGGCECAGGDVGPGGGERLGAEAGYVGRLRMTLGVRMGFRLRVGSE